MNTESWKGAWLSLRGAERQEHLKTFMGEKEMLPLALEVCNWTVVREYPPVTLSPMQEVWGFQNSRPIRETGAISYVCFAFFSPPLKEWI